MSVDKSLGAFVQAAFAAGRSRDEIDEALSRAGWEASERGEALDVWLSIDGMPPVPRPPRRIIVREAMMNALLLVALGMVTWHICQLGFALIDRAFVTPGALVVYPGDSSMRWSIASLIGFVPLFLYLSHRIERERRAKTTPDRKWFASITLFLVAAVLLGDFVTVVYSLLMGDMTLRFLLKAGLVAVTALMVLWYYRGELDAKP